MNGLQVIFLSQEDVVAIHNVLILRLYRNICSSYKKKKVTPNTLSAESYSKSNLNDWLLWLKKTRKCSNSTCNDRLSGVKSFIKFLSIKDIRFNAVYISSKEIKPMRTVKVIHEEITQKAIKSFLVPLEQILEQEKETWQSFILYIA